jgi:hypothetical protein
MPYAIIKKHTPKFAVPKKPAKILLNEIFSQSEKKLGENKWKNINELQKAEKRGEINLANEAKKMMGKYETLDRMPFTKEKEIAFQLALASVYNIQEAKKSQKSLK